MRNHNTLARPWMKRGRPSTLLIGIACGLVLACVPEWSQGQEIQLRSTATIAGPIVALGQVAEITGGTAEDRWQLQQLELGLISGERPRITSQEIREALVADGWNLLYWQVSGANQVELAHPIRSAVTPRPLAVNRDRLAPTSFPPQPPGGVVPAGGSFPTMHPSTQRTMIAQAQWQQTTGERLVADSAPRRATTAGGPTHEVLAFKQEMKRGQIVSETDLERLELSRPAPRGTVVDPAQIVGQALRQTVPPGRPILATSLEPIKHVQRGSEVRLLSRVGAIEVSTTARSLADGALGQTVTVESLDRKRHYVGQIIGFQTVQIVSGEQISDGAIVGQTNGGAISSSVRPPAAPGNPLR
jgi:flagellar basal body P-ring formation protein FlgA